MERSLSVSDILSRTLRRLSTSGLQCGLLALIAFLPLAGLTLLSPDQIGAPEQQEFFLASVVMVRFLTPFAACLMLTYLARQDGRLGPEVSLWSWTLTRFLPAVGLVLAVMFFTGLATLMLVVPGVSFLLGSSIALPVLIVERTRIPEAVRLSWERTKGMRSELFGFWSLCFAVATGVCGATILFFTGGELDKLSQVPLAQSEALLPLVVVCSLLYGALVCASYELYGMISERSPETPEPIE